MDSNYKSVSGAGTTPLDTYLKVNKQILLEMQGTKDDSGKPRMDLLPRAALEQVAYVLTYGASKYESHNWRKGMQWSRVYGAALRHLFAHLDGADKDPESGLSHLAHAACNLCFLLTYEQEQLGTDDRLKPSGGVK